MSKVLLTLIGVGLVCFIIYVTYKTAIAEYKRLTKKNKKK